MWTTQFNKTWMNISAAEAQSLQRYVECLEHTFYAENIWIVGLTGL